MLVTRSGPQGALMVQCAQHLGNSPQDLRPILWTGVTYASDYKRVSDRIPQHYGKQANGCNASQLVDLSWHQP